MSKMKAKVEASEVLKFLQDKFDKTAESIEFLSGGEMSQALRFNAKNQDFIIRLSMFISAFYKDKYAYEHFASDTIPIPKVYKLGKFDDEHSFCITEAKSGKTIDNWDKATQKKLYLKLYKILDAIHAIKLPPGKYGWWEGEGIAEFDSWQGYLLNKINDPYAKF